MNDSEKRKLLGIFSKLYPDPRSELCFGNDYQLLVAVMLSAQTTDKKVNEVTPALFEKFPDFSTLRQARISSIEKIIRPINYFKTKAKHLKAMADLVTSDHQGKLPTTYKELRALPGVGNKTANVVLCELGLEATLPVDTHVFRVARRLKLAKGKTPEKVEQELKQTFADKHWRNLHHWFILHGRRVCKAQKPLCSECRISKLCPSVQE